MAELVIVDVFCGSGHTAGNRLAVIIGGDTDLAARQQRAAELGYSETVFLDDVDGGVVDIYTPSIRLPFTGHPLVGVSRLLRARLGACDVVHPGAGAVPTWPDGDFSWVSGRPEWV
ncbi:MAG TPA: PhzF family phenazine biosynthesis protein, partial [Pseudonocardia sp.]